VDIFFFRYYVLQKFCRGSFHLSLFFFFVCSYLCCLSFILFFSFRFALCSYFGKFHIVERIDCILILKKTKQKHNKNIRSWFFFSAMPDANYIFLSHLIPWIFLFFFSQHNVNPYKQTILSYFLYCNVM
jgi:hypothetical protein